MPRMWEKGSGWVNVPDERVEELYLTGNYAFPDDASVNVRLPNGIYTQIDSEKFSKLLNAGGGYDTALERERRTESERGIAQTIADEDEYGGWSGSLAAGALGVARGVLTEPLADYAFTHLTSMTEEDITKHEQVNAGWLGTGEVGGFIGTALLTGGGRAAAGAAVTGAGKVGLAKQLATKAAKLTPGGLTLRAGHAAEKGLAGKMGLESLLAVQGSKFSAGRLRVGAAGAAGGFVDAGLWAGGSAIGEEYLGDPSKTAGEMFRETGITALVGGTLGGVVSLALAGGSGMASALGAIESKAGAPISKKAGAMVDRLSEAMGKGDFEQLQKFRDPDYVRKALDVDDHLDTTAVEVTHLVDDIITTFEDVAAFAKGDRKKSRMYKEVATGNEFEAVTEILQMYGKMEGHLGQMAADRMGSYTGTAASEFLQAIDASKDALVRELKTRFGERVRRTKGGKIAGPITGDSQKWSDFSPWLFNHLDDFKKNVGGKTFLLKDFEYVQQDLNTYGNLKSVYDSFKNILEDERFWGKTAADMQREVNAPFTTLLEIWPQFNRAFAKKVGKVYRSDVKRIRSFLKSRAGMEKIADAPESINTMKMKGTFEAFEAFVHSVRTHYNPRAGDNIVSRMRSTNGSINALDETLNGAKALQKMASEGGRMGGLLRFVGPYGSYQLGGPAAAAAATMLSEAVMNPAQAIRIRGALQKMKNEAQGNLRKSTDDTIRRIFKKPAKPGRKPAKEPWLRRLHILGNVTEDKDAKTRSKVARKAQATAQAVTALSSSPERMGDLLGNGLAILDGAPDLQEALRQRTMAVMSHINSNLPIGMHRTTDLLTGEIKFMTTDVAAAEYNTMVETGNDWLTTVTDAFAERRVTPGMMDVAMVADPDGVAEWRALVHDGVINSRKPVPPGMFGQLSIALDMPVSPLYSGSVVQMLQNLHTTGEEGGEGFKPNRPSVIKGRARDEKSGTQAMKQPALSVV